MGQRKGKGKGDRKGKGKGKNGGQGGNPTGDKAKKESRTCHWCQKVGHLIEECRAKKAGKPRVKPTKDAGSLDDPSGDWTEEDDCGSITEEPMKSLEESVDMLMPIDEDSGGEEICKTCQESDCECDDEDDDDDEDDWTDETPESGQTPRRASASASPARPSSPDVTTPARPSFLSQFSSPSHGATPAGTLGMGSLLSPTQSPSVSEVIAEQQRALRIRMDEILSPAKATTPKVAKAETVSVPAPPGIPEPPDFKKNRKNRNKSAKARRIRVLDPRECSPGCGCEKGKKDSDSQITARTRTADVGVDATVNEPEKVVSEMGSQTNTSLPHTMHDVLWSAKGLDPVVDYDEDGDDDDDNAAAAVAAFSCWSLSFQWLR